MVCIYCGSGTQVINSRVQRRSNQVWRRRRCVRCGAIFTTVERPDLAASLRVQQQGKRALVPFSREKLLISIYESCKHRPNALDDATAMIELILPRIMNEAANGLLSTEQIAESTLAIVSHFDRIAGEVYAAYHGQLSAN